jgi:hypothetical protein
MVPVLLFGREQHLEDNSLLGFNIVRLPNLLHSSVNRVPFTVLTYFDRSDTAYIEM